MLSLCMCVCVVACCPHISLQCLCWPAIRLVLSFAVLESRSAWTLILGGAGDALYEEESDLLQDEALTVGLSVRFDDLYVTKCTHEEL